MKIALAVLVLSPALLAGGCKEKVLALPPPHDAMIGEWACAIDTGTVNAKIDTTFAGDGTLVAKIAITSNPEGQRTIAKLDAAGGWSRTGSRFTQSLTFTVTSSTINGVHVPESAAMGLARSLALNGDGVLVRKIDAAEFVYETRAGLVICKR